MDAHIPVLVPDNAVHDLDWTSIPKPLITAEQETSIRRV